MVFIMKELVEVIAKALVDSPDEVVVTEKQDGKNITVELEACLCHHGDARNGYHSDRRGVERG
jgi:septum formation topological specificity factor MinE